MYMITYTVINSDNISNKRTVTAVGNIPIVFMLSTYTESTHIFINYLIHIFLYIVHFILKTFIIQ